jgi:glucose/mannose-6-phosphate isomerase
MFDLNNVEAIHAADPDNMLGHILNLPQQLEAGWTTADAVNLPSVLQHIDRVVISGMGGSAIAGSLLAALMSPVSPLPIVVARDYDLPALASGANTLVIASSYSGNTEETLSAFDQARARGCQIVAMATGGRLLELADQFGVPYIRINYQSQPRAALGWSLAPLLNIAARLKWLPAVERDLAEALAVMRAWNRELNAESPIAQNLAKREAGQLMGRIVFVLGAGYFAEVARRWKDQFNENAKAWSAFEALPEADHNFLAGTDWPADFTRNVMALFLTGSRDHARNAKRVELTRRALMMAGCNTDLMTARGESPLAQMLSLIQLGDFMSYYLALLNGAEPTQIEALVRFKAEMASSGQ